MGTALCTGHLLARNLNLRDSFAATLEKRFPLGGEHHVPRGAIEEEHAELRFELGDRLTHRRYGDAKTSRCAAKATGLRDVDERNDAGEHVQGHRLPMVNDDFP